VPGNRHAGFGGRLPGKGPISRDLAGQPTLHGSRIEFTQTGDRTDRGDLHAADAVIDAWSYR
jgi:hypothetical protein